MLGEMLLFVVEQVFLLVGCSGPYVHADAECTVWGIGLQVFNMHGHLTSMICW